MCLYCTVLGSCCGGGRSRGPPVSLSLRLQMPQEHLTPWKNANSNTCREMGRGAKLVGALPAVFPCICGARSLLRAKLGRCGMSWEEGRGDVPRYP